MDVSEVLLISICSYCFVPLLTTAVPQPTMHMVIWVKHFQGMCNSCFSFALLISQKKHLILGMKYTENLQEDSV